MISARAIFKCSLVWLACCSSSSSSDPQTTPPTTEQPKDDGRLPGTSSDLKITAPQKFRVSQQRQNTMTVNLERFNNPTVQLMVEGLPKGLTAKVAPIDALATVATIVFEADDSTTQDSRATVNVVGEAAGSKVTAAVELRVTGAPGTFDKSFGKDGKILSYKPFFENNQGETTSVIVEPDNRFVVLWILNNGFALQRFSLDGSPDPTFNGGAILQPSTSDGTWGACVMNGIVRQSDGKYIVYGGQGKSGTSQRRIFLLRLNADGTADSSYGDGAPIPGAKTHTFDTGLTSSSPYDNAVGAALVKVGNAEELLVGGRSLEAGLVVQFDSNGNVSNAFHGGAPLVGPYPAGANPPESHGAVVVDGQRFLIADNTSGVAWQSYGTQGPVTSRSQDAFPSISGAWQGGAAFFADSSIFAASTGDTDVGWGRYAYPGLAEVTAYQHKTSSNNSKYMAGVHVTANQQALVAVSQIPAKGATFMRVNTNGSLDPSFGDPATPGKIVDNLWNDESELFLLAAPVAAKTALTNDDRVILSCGRLYGRIWN